MFQEQRIPRIYAYTDTRFEGMLKVGYTERKAEDRVREQMESVKLPSQSWKIELDEIALREDGSFYDDHAIHRQLKKMGIIQDQGEWFRCTVEDVKAAILAEKKGIINVENRTADFGMRPEQKAAVEKTAAYFRSFEKEEGVVPHFLWNAKMRFGKTFASYQLALEMGWKKLLVLSFKTAVLSAWREDLLSHIDFENWQFASKKEEDLSEDSLDPQRPFVYFASFQDVLGKDSKTGGIKINNKWIHNEEWDCVIFDEYHYGAWRDKSKDLFEKEERKEYERVKKEEEEMEVDIPDYFDEALLPITTKHYLYLSGTPFRALGSGEFIEEQIFNWTYSDEQKAKAEWNENEGKNPYASLPRLVMLTYQLPEHIRQIAQKGEFNEFDLNVFFSAEGRGKNAKFKYENEVQDWLNIIRGQYKNTVEDHLKQGKRPPMPYSDIRLLSSLQHTFWFLPNVASCHAMANLLAQKQNSFYHDYEVIVSVGTQAGIGVDALKPVRKAMGEPLKTKTITLSCQKLTTGVSVAPWTGIFVLRNMSSPETYFQAIFRVQTPWVVKNPDKNSPNREEIVKQDCYVFDFSPNRALSQVATYSNQLNNDMGVSPEQKVAEFIRFLPILAYDGSSMTEISAEQILDITTSGTTATLLATRWQSALLVNVDNVTLQRLLNNEEALRALESIEGFRAIGDDIATIININPSINKPDKPKEPNNGDKPTPKPTDTEIKDKRKKIQEKLKKFATRIPLFMYLSEYREQTLQDVITKLEPELFKKVTGLTVEDFTLLEKIGVFNGKLMNDAIFKFKRYEDSSLNYTGIDKHQGERIGGYNTTKSPTIIEEQV